MSEPSQAPAPATRSEIVHADATFAISTHRDQSLRELELAATIAVRTPERDVDAIENELVAMCHDKDLAGALLYSVPRGGAAVHGRSIEFAREALRVWGFTRVSGEIHQDGEDKRIGSLTAWDLKAGRIESVPVIVEKRQTRYSPDGRVVLSQSTKQRDGKTVPVYIVQATDDEVRELWARALSFAYRDLVDRILPLRVRERCRVAILEALGIPDDVKAKRPRAKSTPQSASRPANQSPKQEERPASAPAKAGGKDLVASIEALAARLQLRGEDLTELAGGALPAAQTRVLEWIHAGLVAVANGDAKYSALLERRRAHPLITEARELALRVAGGEEAGAAKLLERLRAEAGVSWEEMTAAQARRVLDVLRPLVPR